MSIKEVLLRELLHLSSALGEDLSPEKQLELWVGGQSVHNSRTGSCCPDFSCCRPEFEWPVEDKKRFAEAYVDENQELYMMMQAKAIERLIREDYPEMEIDVILNDVYD
jgi:hypothetical protein